MKESETILRFTTFPVNAPNRFSANQMVKPVKFYCLAPEAKAVSLVGGFNGWNPLTNPMRRQPGGAWLAEINLPHGHHQYLFVVDGEGKLDPKAYGVARTSNNRPVSLIAVS